MNNETKNKEQQVTSNRLRPDGHQPEGWHVEGNSVIESEVATTAEQERSARLVLTRREFLYGVLSVAASEVLVACRASDAAGGTFVTATPQQLLQSPVPVATAEPPQTPTPDELQLEQFLTLSAILTGISNLNPVLGRVYMQSLQGAADFELSLPELFEQAGFASGGAPEDIGALEASGFFDDESTRTLADAIIERWYTGVYQQAAENRVATFVDSLAWKALDFTKPPTICGAPGFWAEAPGVG
jgi:hypothetical protein